LYIYKVLINLITNAIKFTRLETTRHISVSVGASVDQPVSTPGGIQFIAPKLVPDAQLQKSWSHDSGSSIYSPILHIVFSVKDTGRGLSEEEIQNLFARFSQASPRTHINYGGSGLGLYISRRLTEMQGGAIGLSSVEKRGSTFAFYIKVRRVTTADTEKRRGSIVDIEETNRKLMVDNGFKNRDPENSRNGKPKRPMMLRHASNNIASIARGLDVATSVDGKTNAEKRLPDPLHILIVEDNIVNQRVLAMQLRKLGCVVSVANHGLECLKFLARTRWWRGCPSHKTTMCDTESGKATEDEMKEKEDIRVHGDAEKRLDKPACRECSDIDIDIDKGNTEKVGLDLHLILLDSEMPVMSGLVCIQRIRALEQDGHLARPTLTSIPDKKDVPHSSSNTNAKDTTNKRMSDTPTTNMNNIHLPSAEASKRSTATYDTTTELKGRIPVIGVTANVRQMQVEEAIGMGMDDVVGKPFKTGEVWGAIVRILVGESQLKGLQE
jgi:CheY-like chemotaxis protein